MNKIFLKIMPAVITLSMALSACTSTPQPVPTAAPVPSPISALASGPAPTSTSIPMPKDDVWDRITASNKIVVGVSWDYPPFASLDPNFQVVGYDVALIQEIGSRLNIPVDIQNFSFEGLPGALQLNQIDLAVAAISITPERLGRMTFSPVYFINKTAILARADSTIPVITRVEELSRYRVGVQRGTSYENWVQRSLVDTGLMPSIQLLSYMTAEDAVRDLQADRVDVVVTGLATASYYNIQKGLQVIGQGFEQQNLAMAMRLGTPRLKAEIDRVMGDMLTDGTIMRLIQQYVQNDVSEVVPTPIPPFQPSPTPLPPAPTVSPAGCVDGMKFIEDVTYDDNNMNNPPLLKPGESFVKVWRLQNIGTCSWTPAYHLVYAYGNVDTAKMNGQQISVPGNVVPGGTADFSVTLTAPLEPYTYQGFWQMENSSAQRFGQTVWVGISTQSDQNSSSWQPAGSFCQVILTGPAKILAAGEAFDAVWTVKNISGRDWDMASVDYKFISGTEMHNKTTYDLSQTIKNGESASIGVGMLAPASPGTYSAQWAIVSGNSALCNLAVTVAVN